MDTKLLTLMFIELCIIRRTYVITLTNQETPEEKVAAALFRYIACVLKYSLIVSCCWARVEGTPPPPLSGLPAMACPCACPLSDKQASASRSAVRGSQQ